MLSRGGQDPYVDAHDRYRAFREAAYNDVQDRLERHIRNDPKRFILGLRLVEIDDWAIHEWRRVWRSCHPGEPYDGNFPWDEIFRQIRSTPRRFSLAICANGVLYGLAAGMASRGSDNVTIRFIERRFGSNPLAGLVAPIAIEAAEAYAMVLGRHRIKLRNPVEGVRQRYLENGFSLDRSLFGATYLSREVYGHGDSS